jgi:hypothetical protein
VAVKRRKSPVQRAVGGVWTVTIGFTTKDGVDKGPCTFELAESYVRNHQDSGWWLKNLTENYLKKYLT